MTTATRLAAHALLYGLLVILFGWFLALPSQIKAQSQGNNAVYNTSLNVVGSSAFIDASAFAGGTGGADICAVLYGIISGAGYPGTGAVIDARGFNASNAPTDANGNLTCAGTPWSLNGTSTPNPATIVLPYTQIAISQTWVLTNGSRIVGKAPAFAPGPSLQAAGSGFTGSSMIQMGSSTSCPANGCTGVTIEHLTLDANNKYIDAIDNPASQEQSYVDDVNLKNVGLTGLNITASHSGPYSNIRFTAYKCSSQCPVGVDIESQTRGLHSITCAGPSGGDSVLQSAGHAAIFVNASNNSVEDVHVEGFWDAVEVGNTTASTVSNVTLANVTGAGGGSGKVQNTIHICGSHYNAANACMFKTGTTKDVTILQAFGGKSPNTALLEGVLQDDVTGTTIASPAVGVPSTVGLYVLGEPQPSSSTTQYSRFSTSPNTATWGVGATAATGTSCSTPGALYSNTSGSSTTTIYVCTKSTGTLSWQEID